MWKYDDVMKIEKNQNDNYNKLFENIDKNFVKDRNYEKITYQKR